MNFEDLETTRVQYVNRLYAAMIKIVEDEKAQMEHRLVASKVIGGISEDHIKAYLMSEATKTNESVHNKMADKLDKLDKFTD